MPTTHNQRYNRCQGYAIAQTSVAVALLSALSIAGLGTSLSLLQNKEFVAALHYKFTFAATFVLFFACIFCSCTTVISRTLDFRITARKVRKQSDPGYDKPLTIFWLTSKTYGKLTWFFLWSACLTFAIASATLVISAGAVYAFILFGKNAA